MISANEDKSIGHVSGRVGDFLIVEHGHLRKSHNPLPLAFADVDETGKRVVTTLAHDIVYGAPPVTKGQLDEQAAAQYYGLAETQPVDGLVDVDDHDLKADTVGAQAGQSPSLLGDRQPSEAD